ncbi:uncharacterized protein LOC121860363 isoform X2 [Homarus americanus]|uniref:uncharacterized protein LOC121860363 isoform X2 n=1 Tax=Homarus americanus TaxID=6706 RepID=UPI001C440E87|nr:uncharacterized protein LOC121860363 isoform X2 [Homarus americanus]
MKLSGRVLELNCLFLLVVALLVALQLFLQRAQQQLHVNKRNKGIGLVGPIALPLQDSVDMLQAGPGLGQDGEAVAPEDALVAAPFVPNIRKSFTKRKAPYVRKGKKNKKKKAQNKKNKQQKHGPHGEGEGRTGGPQGGGKLGNSKKPAGPRGEGKPMIKVAGKSGAQNPRYKSAQNKHTKKNGSTGTDKNKLKSPR